MAISRKAGDVQLQCAILNSLGIAYQDHGDLMRAVQCHQQRLALAELSGDRVDQAITLNNLGDIHRVQRHHDEAIDWYERGRRFSREADNKYSEAHTLLGLGPALARSGQRERALPLWRLARDILDAPEAPETDEARRLLGEEYDTRAGSGGGVA